MKFILSVIASFLSCHSSFATSEVSAAPPIHVPPEFRQIPLWYWQNPERKCVPVPSEDIVTRIAPDRLRQEKAITQKSDCALKVDSRRIKAELMCDQNMLTVYYSKESLCKEAIGTKQASLY